MLQLPSGKVLPSYRLNNILVGIPEIDRFRFIQKSPGHLVLQLVLRRNLAEGMLQKMQEEFLKYLEEPVAINIQIIDVIQEDTLKFKTFISEIQ